MDRTTSVNVQPQGTVWKAGPRVRLEEVEALKVARSLGLAVPVVHDVRVLPEEGGVGFSMDHVHGDSLETAWKEMDAEEKDNIARQLGQMISQLRSASQDQVRIGACGGPARDCRRRTQYTGGPFLNEADFNAFLLDFYKATPIAIQQALRDSLETNHRIVFTHGDLSPRNIVVSDGHITGLLDWEVSGWYPEHWEYVKFFECVTDCKDWKSFAHEIFETQYPKELVSYQALARWQKP